MRRRYVEVSCGQLHAVECGEGPTVLLLHQTPRSWDEYREVLPLLAAGGVRGIAVDTPGFGASDPLPVDSIEAWAGVLAETIDALALAPVIVVGHHTGGVIAVELAGQRPSTIRGLVLSSTPMVDGAFRERKEHGVDNVVTGPDGRHLLALWRGRADFYPPDRPDLLERFVRDAMTAGFDRSSSGHTCVRRYHMEERLPTIKGLPVLLVGAPEDPFGFPELARMTHMLPEASVREIPGGHVPLPDQCPEEFAHLVLDFIAELDRGVHRV